MGRHRLAAGRDAGGSRQRARGTRFGRTRCACAFRPADRGTGRGAATRLIIGFFPGNPGQFLKPTRHLVGETPQIPVSGCAARYFAPPCSAAGVALCKTALVCSARRGLPDSLRRRLGCGAFSSVPVSPCDVMRPTRVQRLHPKSRAPPRETMLFANPVLAAARAELVRRAARRRTAFYRSSRLHARASRAPRAAPTSCRWTPCKPHPWARVPVGPVVGAAGCTAPGN